MSAPSEAHEQRRALLCNVASLAGLTEQMVLGVGLQPDVALRCRSKRLLLIGDAKATESPGCRATARRLRHYGGALFEVVRSGIGVRLVLSVPACEQREVDGWAIMLLDAAWMLPQSASGHVRLDDLASLVWVDLRR